MYESWWPSCEKNNLFELECILSNGIAILWPRDRSWLVEDSSASFETSRYLPYGKVWWCEPLVVQVFNFKELLLHQILEKKWD